MKELESLLTDEDAARILNVSAGTLRNWRHLSKGPPVVLVGAAVRYSPEHLRQYIEARTRQAGPVAGRPHES